MLYSQIFNFSLFLLAAVRKQRLETAISVRQYSQLQNKLLRFSKVDRVEASRTYQVKSMAMGCYIRAMKSTLAIASCMEKMWIMHLSKHTRDYKVSMVCVVLCVTSDTSHICQFHLAYLLSY